MATVSRSLAQREASFESLELERSVLKCLCECGGSLSLTALRDTLVEERKINQGSSEAVLRRFLENVSPHNVRLFRLDDDEKRNECTVRAKTDAELCKAYNPSNNRCQKGKRCQDFHLCSYFISAKCKNSKKCKWPHTLHNKHNESILAQNGLACLTDKHIFMVLRQSWINITVPDICKHYNSSNGCSKEPCHFLHVCRHYIQGDCRFTNANKQDCRYSHDVKGPQPMSVWKQYRHIDARSKSPMELIRLLQEKKKQEAEEERVDDDSDEEDEEDDDGSDEETATFKSSCSIADKKMPEICFHYNGKGCNKGKECHYLHICRHFVDSSCRNGDGCRLSHDVKSSHCVTVWNNFNIDALSKSGGELLSVIRTQKSSGRDRRRSRNQSESDNGDKNEICEYHLRGKCNFGDQCRKFHSEQPFQWQVTRDDGKTWTSFGAKENDSIEKAFCDIQKANIKVMLSGNKLSRFSFKTMSLDVETNNWAVRRIETPSVELSDFSEWTRIMRTNWQWYFLDNGNIWVQYEQNANIEEAYQKYLAAKQDSIYLFETEQFYYELDFSTMEQKNTQVDTKRQVRRRPLKLLTKDMIDRNLKKLHVLAVILPKHWDSDSADLQNNFTLCKLDPGLHTEEMVSVNKRFMNKMADTCRILKIERVQNKELWQDFVMKREKMKDQQEDTSKDPAELLLFHGTTDSVIKAICQQNFDFRISGSRVGTKWGKGSYFSTSAKYSDSYASPNSQGKKFMFLVRVLVGSYTQGDPSYARPPLKDGSKLHGPLYDSCVDNPLNPLIYVIFDRCQVYPAYLITYK